MEPFASIAITDLDWWNLECLLIANRATIIWLDGARAGLHPSWACQLPEWHRARAHWTASLARALGAQV